MWSSGVRGLGMWATRSVVQGAADMSLSTPCLSIMQRTPGGGTGAAQPIAHNLSHQSQSASDQKLQPRATRVTVD